MAGGRVDLASIIQSVEASAIAEWMRTSVKAMPVVESIHVLAAATVFGTIFIVDLRLLGFPNTHRPFTRISGEILRLTWVAFSCAVITGLLMFAANASTYFGNTAFRLKMLALLLAGVNMAIFQSITFRGVSAWDVSLRPPLAGRAAGALSILIWITVIFIARWIGFTKGYDFEVPENLDLNFE
jgi:tryptophan-rich sensory protein